MALKTSILTHLHWCTQVQKAAFSCARRPSCTTSHWNTFACTVGVEMARYGCWYIFRKPLVCPCTRPQLSIFKVMSRSHKYTAYCYSYPLGSKVDYNDQMIFFILQKYLLWGIKSHCCFNYLYCGWNALWYNANYGMGLERQRWSLASHRCLIKG